jgi:nitroimidazol reductase NimA-like FMN-containing flavoprotein (pyridoxamine 5'-phosphate oxidase superfamily)
LRRRDREITSRAEIDAVIHGSLVCRVAMTLGDGPYLVPLSFGYDGRVLFFHTTGVGRKLEGFEAGGRVCFELERNVELVEHPQAACEWSFRFESVIGYGTVSEIVDAQEKESGLNQIMRHYSGRAWELPRSGLDQTRIWRVGIESVSGKRSAAK